MRPPCTVFEGCTQPQVGRGACNGHYKQMRAGRPVTALRPRRVSGRYAEERWETDNGYIARRVIGHPLYVGTRAFWDFEHRVVMAEMLGRLLLPGENVHHRNGHRQDNRPDNLELWLVHQPKGQRVEDLLEYAKTIITRYEPTWQPVNAEVLL